MKRVFALLVCCVLVLFSSFAVAESVDWAQYKKEMAEKCGYDYQFGIEHEDSIGAVRDKLEKFFDVKFSTLTDKVDGTGNIVTYTALERFSFYGVYVQFMTLKPKEDVPQGEEYSILWKNASLEFETENPISDFFSLADKLTEDVGSSGEFTGRGEHQTLNGSEYEDFEEPKTEEERTQFSENLSKYGYCTITYRWGNLFLEYFSTEGLNNASLSLSLNRNTYAE